ncbi:hypothetical protein V9L05_19170 [Bernardetia sp. Wsw4-3y2]|uniref:RDD family protein n=1 Tax=Bernardetia sp. Wsw4-3y2 TaxID=3127471 RepID=UPI0030CFF223
MKNTLILTKNQTHFLQENRQDPITSDSFSLGDEIIFCAECKSAFLKESWEYMGSEHCNQRKTFNDFPKTAVTLLFQKVDNSVYIKSNSDDHSLAFLLDLFIAGVLGGLVYLFLPYFKFEQQTIFDYSLGIGLLYIIFRDCILGDGSCGKKWLGLYFITTDSNEKAHFLLLFVRNLIYWIPMFLVSGFLFWISTDSIFSLFIVVVLLILHIIQALALLTTQFSLFDKLLRIKLMQKRDEK